MTQARDGGNLMRDEYRHLVYNLTKALQTEVVVLKNGRRFAFNDLCEVFFYYILQIHLGKNKLIMHINF